MPSNDQFLYAADNAGPLLTFDGAYRLRRHRDLQFGRGILRAVRGISRRMPRARIAATSR
ncbi:hypothetical protein SAMN04487968_10245 [Nocardioides terrae]|uniref:Uncharacterized protein n=1 Tax=Nocardioides terrae TaxID=574651 RepID=A0A1I1EKR9_9ACTN|nr:hypothetical protein [Nocardioides terrae]SFB85503.1 hypothetical protein SAMN04487968_10245 [Nocardioides terrae]